MSEQPLEHWPTERMVLEGHTEYALREDLDDLSDEDLAKVAEICIVNEFAPDECIPCYAHTVYLDRQQKHLEDMAPDVPEEFSTDHPLREALEDMAPEDPEPFILPDMKDRTSSDEDEAEDFTQPDANHPAYDPVRDFSLPPVERMHHEVKVLNEIMEEILHGPPIPPKDVSVAELAMLVIAADKYIRMTEAQGVELATNQQQVLDATKALVARLRS